MYKLIMFRMILAMWLSLVTTFAAESELTLQNDSASKPRMELEVKQQEPIEPIMNIAGYACNPDTGDYFPGEKGDFLGLPSNQSIPLDLTPYWADYP